MMICRGEKANKMKKISVVTSVVMVLVMLSLSLSGCGKPKGALLWIYVNHDNSTVSIDGEEAVPYRDIKNPVLLPPNMHKITVEYLETGDVETKTMSLFYGYEYKVTFDKYEEAAISLSSKIPANIVIGKIDLGIIPTDESTIVHAGERKLNGELVGFGYRWSETRTFKTSDQIMLQPGTDDDHGAIYIESSTSGAMIQTSLEDEPMEYNGSIFLPMVKPGVVEITEKYSENIVHFVNVYPGRVTTLEFVDDHAVGENSHNFILPDSSSTELLVNWGEGGVTRCYLGENRTSITDLELEQFTPFRGSGIGLKGTQKHFISRYAGNIAVASFSGELPKEIKFRTSREKKINLLDIKPMDVQHFSPASPDGKYYHFEDGIISADGGSYIALKSFIPGSWNIENSNVIVTATASSCGTLEARVASLLGRDDLMFPQVTIEDIIDVELDYKSLQGFFLGDYQILMVFGIPGRTRLWNLTLDEATEIIDIPRGMHNSSLYGKRYLVCYPEKESKAFGYVFDIKTGKVSENIEEIPELSLLSDGRIISGYNPNSVSAGIIYEWVSGELTPVSAGVFGLK
jgi:hypothetical protein